MNEDFDLLPWHDAELQEVLIDRRSAGIRDEVRLKVGWPQGGEATIIFDDCYAMEASLNFGVIAEERVAAASVVAESQLLQAIRERWASIGVPLELLRCYHIETSSTSSSMRIYAKGFRVEVV